MLPDAGEHPPGGVVRTHDHTARQDDHQDEDEHDIDRAANLVGIDTTCGIGDGGTPIWTRACAWRPSSGYGGGTLIPTTATSEVPMDATGVLG